MTDSKYSRERLMAATNDWSRRDLLRGAGALGVVLGSTTLLSACGVGGGDAGGTSTAGPAAITFDEALKSKSIKIGFAEEAPWAFVDKNGELTGYAPTVARAVFKKLGIDNVQGETSTFDSMIDNLRAKKFAMSATGLYITPGRCKTSQFAIPDVQVGLTFVVPKGNPKNIKSYKDVIASGVKIATVSGGAGIGMMKDAGVPDGQVVPMESNDSMIRAVQNQDVYGYLLSDVTGNWIVKTLPNSNLEATESFKASGQVDVASFNFRLEDTAFRDAYNEALIELHKSGEWLKIVEPFGMTKANDTYPDLATTQTTDRYCGLT